MKVLISIQYFTVAMVLTITVGLFTLKPQINNHMATTAQLTMSALDDNKAMENDLYK